MGFSGHTIGVVGSFNQMFPQRECNDIETLNETPMKRFVKRLPLYLYLYLFLNLFLKKKSGGNLASNFGLGARTKSENQRPKPPSSLRENSFH